MNKMKGFLSNAKAHMNGTKGFFSDAKAVSPVIAVLVLIVVAVIGAVGVGALQTELQDKTSNEAKIGELGATEVRIIGGPGVSTMMAGPMDAGATVKSEEAPEGSMLAALNEEYPKINIGFLRECCGFAMYAMPNDACDMGIGRRFPTTPEKSAYPELKYQVIAKAPIAVIVGNSTLAANTANNETNVTGKWNALQNVFINKTGGVAFSTSGNDSYNFTVPVAYAFDSAHVTAAGWEGGAGTAPPGEVYGTSIQGMFSLYLMRGPSASNWVVGGATDNLKLNTAIGGGTDYKLVNTPEEMIETVLDTEGAIGFVDYNYAVDVDGITILGLDTDTTLGVDANTAPEEIGTADTTNTPGGDGYVTGLGGPMFTPVVITTFGEPDTAEQTIIDYMAMFHGVEIMAEHGFLAGENTVVSAACPFHTA